MKNFKIIFSFMFVFVLLSFVSISAKAEAWSNSLYDEKNDVVDFIYKGKDGKISSVKVSSQKEKSYKIMANGKEVKFGESEINDIYDIPQNHNHSIQYAFSKDSKTATYAENNGTYYVLRLVNEENPEIAVGETSAEEEYVRSYELIPYKPIALDRHNKSKVRVGKRIQLDILMADGKVSWKSSNKSIATVSNGKVLGKKAGKVKITASCGSAKITKTITVWKVKQIKITGKKKVKAGKSIQLKAKVICTSGGSSKNVKWKSSNTKYATVDSNGKVTAKKAGKGKVVKITAIAKDGKNIKKTKKIRIK